MKPPRRAYVWLAVVLGCWILPLRQAAAQATEAQIAAATAIANGLPVPGTGASQVTTENDEEAAFESAPSRMKITTVPVGWEAPMVFVLYENQAPKPKGPEKPEVKKTFIPNADIVRRMFAQVRVSSISITKSRRVAVVAYREAEMRVHPGELVLGSVTVKEIEKDRVLFQYQGMPPIWIYRVRPGMMAPEVVAQQ